MLVIVSAFLRIPARSCFFLTADVGEAFPKGYADERSAIALRDYVKIVEYLG
ncbi:MAG: hypothetical protein ACRCT1_09440 [Microcoleaceae cyanobacterium]